MRWLLCVSLCAHGGIVVDQNGKPVAGAIVAAGSRRVITTAGGAFQIYDQRSPFIVFHPNFQPALVPPDAERVVLTTLEAARELPPCQGQVIDVGPAAVRQFAELKLLFIGDGERHSTVHYESAELKVMLMHRDDDTLHFSMPSDLPVQVWKAKSKTGIITRGKNAEGHHWAWVGDLGQSSLIASSANSQEIDKLLASLCAL